ncbi:MAG: hypothetical protein AB7O97_06460 [Planctomycetota bacterium]
MERMPVDTTRRKAALALAALLLAAGGGDEFARGARAYAAGDFAAAQAAFAAAVAARGSDAPAALHFDLGLAALRAGDLRAAASALAAAQDGGRGDAALLRQVAFAAGHVAFARGERLARLAQQPEAEPFVYERAIEALAAARTHWVEAVLGEGDWPAARRNAERAQQRLDQVRLLQQQRLQQNRSTGAQQRPMLLPGQDPGDDRGDGQGGGAPTDTAPNPLQANDAQLSAAAVAELFAVLEQKEREKRALRRAQRRAGDAAVERDW